MVIDDESDNTEQDPGTSDPAISPGEERRRHNVRTRRNTGFSGFSERCGYLPAPASAAGASFVSPAVKPVGKPDA